MLLTTGLALTLGLVNGCLGLTIPTEYEQGEILEGSEADMKYVIFWKSTKTHVTFEVRVNTIGMFVAFVLMS